jgi:chromosome segregation ATPase
MSHSDTELPVGSASSSEGEEDGLSNQAAARGDIDGRSSSWSPRNGSDRRSTSSDDDFVRVDPSEAESLEERLRKSEEEKRTLNSLLDIARTKADGLYGNLRDSEEKRAELENLLSEALRETEKLKLEVERKDYKLNEKRRMILDQEAYIRIYHRDLEYHIARANAAEERLSRIDVDRSRFERRLYQRDPDLMRPCAGV